MKVTRQFRNAELCEICLDLEWKFARNESTILKLSICGSAVLFLSQIPFQELLGELVRILIVLS